MAPAHHGPDAGHLILDQVTMTFRSRDDLTTHPSLLLRIRDPGDHEAWVRFVTLYAPLIFRFLRRHRIQEADAADLSQEVFSAVAMWIDRLKYDPQRGLFRGWLFAITRHKLLNHINRNQLPDVGSGDTKVQKRLEAEPDREQPIPDDRVWDEDYEICLLHWAAEKVQVDFRGRTWQAFWQTRVEGKSTEVVAEALGMTPGAVYIAKCRVLKKLRDEVQLVEGIPH
jgi:RNA polymerase sigma-70 factor (ECF subfamily)